MAIKHFTTTANGRILDPAGRDFRVIGTNVNGNAMWGQKNGRESSSVRQDIELIADVWKFNTIRVVCTLQFNHPDVWNRIWHYDDIDAIVADFTAKGVVTMLELHDYTGVYPLLEPGTVNATGDARPVSLYEFTDGWIELASKYKDNPYVWINIMNEPSHNNNDKEWVHVWREFFKKMDGREYPGTNYDKQLDVDTYYYVHDYIINALRNAGIDNLIVCDENHYGQASFDVEDPLGNGSACIYCGPKLSAKHKNLVYSIHPYGWTDFDKMKKYADTMKELNLAWIFGEYGPMWGDYATHQSTFNVLTIGQTHNIGHMYWDWSNDPMAVVDKDLPGIIGGWGWEIDCKDGTKPKNLSWYGKLLWDDTRGQLTLPLSRFTMPFLVNGDFAKGITNPWHNHGGQLQISKGASHDGSDCAQLLAGNNFTGQEVDPANFKPGYSYVLSAWGKVSFGASGDNELVFAYTPTGTNDENQAAVLTFNASEWEHKETTFQIPADVKIAKARVFFFRKDDASATDFFFDKVNIRNA